MADYKNYLAARILTEDKVVTYRLLSRALKVHVNTAKEMLYEFHSQQNAKKPGSILATYIVGGTKRDEESGAGNANGKKDGEDEYMQSSPFAGSSMPRAEDDNGTGSVLTISLTREEDLEGLLSQYEKVTSIHIYSLGPHPLKDLQILSDVTREMQDLCANEDPLETLAQYGTIVNPKVQRRALRKPPPAGAAPSAKLESSRTQPTKAGAALLPKKEEPKPQLSNAKDFFGKGKEKSKPSNEPSKESAAKPPPTLKHESSSIFKSFAKAKPKLKAEGTDSSAAPNAAEDEPMKNVSDDEEETYVPPPQPSKENLEGDRRKRIAREEALRRMMEDDDEEEEEAAAVQKVEADEEEERPRSKSESVDVKEESVVVGDGRRRGKRRVMKKKTVKNAEGYLVTSEEPVWESFSEDEPVAAPKQKAQAATSTTAKGKKPAAKPGQGSIMSFFGKK